MDDSTGALPMRRSSTEPSRPTADASALADTSTCQSEDLLAAQLRGDLVAVHERSQELAWECVESLRFMQEEVASQIDELVATLHSENLIFVQNTLTFANVNRQMSAGTGEMGDTQPPSEIPQLARRTRPSVDADLLDDKFLSAKDARRRKLDVPDAHKIPSGRSSFQSSNPSDVPSDRTVSFDLARQSSHSTTSTLPGEVPVDAEAEPSDEGRCRMSMTTLLGDDGFLPNALADEALHDGTNDASHGGERESDALTGTKALELFKRSPTIHDMENQRKVFPSNENLKDQVRSALLKNHYNVKMMYSDTGIAQAVAKSNYFELITLAVVALNAVWIAVELDLNKEETPSKSHPVFQIAEHVFCVYFTAELATRFIAFKKKMSAFRDSWFLFDLVLVAMMVFETWIMAILLAFETSDGSSSGGGGPDPSMLKLFRLIRLTRMARMARLLRWMPELMILLKGLWLASRSVFFTLVLLVGTIYVFALVFRQLTDGTSIGEEYFKTVPASMSSLLLRGVLPDLADWVNTVGDEHFAFAALLISFILFASLTVMNMLVGVLVEVVAMVSTMENETIMVNMVRSKMLKMIEYLQLDLDGNGQLSSEEFEQLLVHPEAAQFMQNVGVDVVGLVEFSAFIFKERDLEFPEFVEMVLQLRGTNQATVKDVVDMRKQMHEQNLGIIEDLGTLTKDMTALQGLADDLKKLVEQSTGECKAAIKSGLTAQSSQPALQLKAYGDPLSKLAKLGNRLKPLPVTKPWTVKLQSTMAGTAKQPHSRHSTTNAAEASLAASAQAEAKELFRVEASDLGSVTGTRSWSKALFTEGVNQFHDRSHKLSRVPSYLLDTILFQGPCHHQSGDRIILRASPGKKILVYILVSHGNQASERSKMREILCTEDGWEHVTAEDMDTGSSRTKGFDVFSQTTSGEIPLTLTTHIELSIAMKLQAPVAEPEPPASLKQGGPQPPVFMPPALDTRAWTMPLVNQGWSEHPRTRPASGISKCSNAFESGAAFASTRRSRVCSEEV